MFITNKRKGDMKKVSLFALLSLITLPVCATDASVATTENAIVQSEVKPVTESVVPDAVQPETNVVSQPVAEPVVESAPVEKVATPEVKPETKSEPKIAESKGSFLDGVQLGVGASATGGLNGFVGYANKKADSFWGKRFGVRFDFATTQPVESVINDAIDSVVGDEGIDVGDNLTISHGKMDAKHFAALIDFYPFGNTWFLGGWRLTGGYAFGDMNMGADVAGVFDGPSGRYEFELSGKKYAYTGNTAHGSANLDWKYHGPYVGTGFDFGLLAGLKIYVDAGVVFTNRAAELSLDVPTDNLQQFNGTTWETVDVPELDAAIQETLSDAQDTLNDFKFYPMVKVGLMYRF